MNILNTIHDLELLISCHSANFDILCCNTPTTKRRTAGFNTALAFFYKTTFLTTCFAICIHNKSSYINDL